MMTLKELFAELKKAYAEEEYYVVSSLLSAILEKKVFFTFSIFYINKYIYIHLYYFILI